MQEEGDDGSFLGKLCCFLMNHSHSAGGLVLSFAQLRNSQSIAHRNSRSHKSMSIEFSLGNFCSRRLSVPLSECATGKGIHCKLVLRLFGFHFCGKTLLLKLWGKDERRRRRPQAADIFISLLNYSDERESWKYFSDLKHFHFFGNVCTEVDSGILAGISQQLLPAFLQVCYKCTDSGVLWHCVFWMFCLCDSPQSSFQRSAQW